MVNLHLLLFSLGTVQALRPAQLVPQSDISKRVTYNGGWALGLAGATCPSDAPVACSTAAGSVNPTCCPSGQTCSGNINPYCCPSSADCINVVTNVPVCANSSWNMYTQGGGDYFCCEPGQYGVLPLHGYAGICEPLDQVVASSLIATPASQAGGAAVTTAGSQTGEGAASTMAVTSTLSNGGVTTISTVVSAARSTATATSTGATGLPSPAGGATATITLTRGAEIGIACAAAVFLIVAALLLWRCLRNRKRKRIAAMNNEGYGYPTQAQGAAPMYSAIPQPQQQQQQSYTVSPVQEYKTPLVGVAPQFGSPTPPPPTAGGYVSPNSPPPNHQHAYGGSPGPGQMQGRYEVPGGQLPVEAPNSWERGVEMG